MQQVVIYYKIFLSNLNIRVSIRKKKSLNNLSHIDHIPYNIDYFQQHTTNRIQSFPAHPFEHFRRRRQIPSKNVLDVYRYTVSSFECFPPYILSLPPDVSFFSYSILSSSLPATLSTTYDTLPRHVSFHRSTQTFVLHAMGRETRYG